MSTINFDRVNVGEIATASTANSIYAQIGAATLDKDNLRTEATVRAHYTGSPVTTFIGQSANATTVGTYNLTTWTFVNHGTPMEINLNRTIKAGDVVRFHANCYIEDVVQDGSDTDAGRFSFKFYWDLGAGYVAVDPIHFTYSLGVRPVGLAAESIYKNRRLGFSFVYIHTGANISVAKARTYCMLTNNANSIDIKQTVFNIIVQEH